MIEKVKSKILLAVVLLAGFATASFSQTSPKHEMRAVWIATVANIDWPSAKGLSTEQQKKEMIDLLDLAKAYHLNTVVFQIRPDADALYDSKIEPWSEWLSGVQGQAPEPYYDPLEFTIEECHKRGLDIHVWLNPYRAVQDTSKSVPAPDHAVNRHPDWILTYGSKQYFDPGIPEVRDHVARVVADLVTRYDIDAIHFDDYFYPYQIANLEFPDQNSFTKYPNGYSAEQKDDWRRNNVNLIIKQLHDTIKAINPSVELGISPFGVWKNNSTDPAGSATQAGVTNYDDLYADILLWAKEGWIDYVTPQLYWYIGKTVADYKILADWWSRNTYGCQLYIGQAPYLLRADSRDKSWQSPEEIVNQIKLNRSYPNIGGSIFFSAKFMKNNPLGIKEILLKDLFRLPALTAPNPRINRILPEIPENASLHKKHKSFELSWEKSNGNKMFVIYKFRKKDILNTENPENIWKVTNETSVLIDKNKNTKTSRYRYAVTAVSPTHNESAPVVFTR